MAEMLSDAGYATGMFGKWHLGDSEGRYPTDQGFDEWFGIPNSSDESYWPDNDLFRPGVHPQVKYEYVMEAKRGQTPTELEVYDTARRLTIDRDITDHTIDFIRRMAVGDQPFFAFVPYTQTHLPVEPHPDNKGKTGNGHWADVLAQTDAYVGEILDAVDEVGIRDNTIFIFTADNGPEGVVPHQGFSGPWRGSYLGRVPDDRVIDSLDQTAFFMGETDESARESVVVYVGRDLYGVKWRDWKMMVKEISTIAGDPVRSYGVPLFYNLLLDPKEEHPVLHAPPNFWVRYPAGQVLVDHGASMQLEPPIPPGTPDPYQPSR
jgi:arylsulfatase